MPVNVVVLLVVLAAASLSGFAIRRYNGHFRGAAPSESVASDSDGLTGTVISAADISGTLGDRATLLQFSSAFCAPCRATRRILAEVAEMIPGVIHVELDAEHHLDLVRRLGVMRTPTTFVLDGSGDIAQRASGAPAKADVIAALGRIIS
jgi:thiol-disulfide isomerase/thioredoxin